MKGRAATEGRGPGGKPGCLLCQAVPGCPLPVNGSGRAGPEQWVPHGHTYIASLLGLSKPLLPVHTYLNTCLFNKRSCANSTPPPNQLISLSYYFGDPHPYLPLPPQPSGTCQVNSRCWLKGSAFDSGVKYG